MITHWDWVEYGKALLHLSPYIAVGMAIAVVYALRKYKSGKNNLPNNPTNNENPFTPMPEIKGSSTYQCTQKRKTDECPKFSFTTHVKRIIANARRVMKWQ